MIFGKETYQLQEVYGIRHKTESTSEDVGKVKEKEKVNKDKQADDAGNSPEDKSKKEKERIIEDLDEAVNLSPVDLAAERRARASERNDNEGGGGGDGDASASLGLRLNLNLDGSSMVEQYICNPVASSSGSASASSGLDARDLSKQMLSKDLAGACTSGGESEAASTPRRHEDEGNTECIICMCEPRDTLILPCRHMAFCNHCAGIMRYQCEKCPICRQHVTSLLQFQRKNDGSQQYAT